MKVYVVYNESEEDKNYIVKIYKSKLSALKKIIKENKLENNTTVDDLDEMDFWNKLIDPTSCNVTEFSGFGRDDCLKCTECNVDDKCSKLYSISCAEHHGGGSYSYPINVAIHETMEDALSDFENVFDCEHNRSDCDDTCDDCKKSRKTCLRKMKNILKKDGSYYMDASCCEGIDVNIKEHKIN